MKKVAAWERPKTTKVYLHPPFAERMVTLWPDFKVICAEHVEDKRSSGFPAVGFIVLMGEDMVEIPWEKTVFETNDDGIPIHKIISSGEITASLEAFCGFGRNPVTYCRVTLRNCSNFAIRDTVSILPRSGNECYLMGINIDGYCSYDPDVNLWLMLPSCWRMEGQVLTDGTGSIFLQAQEKLVPRWVDCRKAKPFRFLRFLEYSYELEPGEEAVLELSLASGAAPGFFCYEELKDACKARWKESLSGIRLFPNTGVPRYRTMYLHLVSQCLQMLARYVGSDDVIPRQGCIARHIWPWEAAEYLTQLDRIGLCDYTDGAYRYFMDKYVQHDGSDKGRVITHGLQWMSMTGSVVWGMAYHLACMGDRDKFHEYKDVLYDCFSWIQRTRMLTSAPGSGYRYRGIFPAGQSCDWEDSIQDWSFTDAQNVMGLRELTRLYERFGDSRSMEVREACDEYESALKSILEELTAGKEDDDEISLPYKLGEQLADPPNWPYFAVGPVYLIRAGIIEPGSRVFGQLENWFRNRGYMKNGLTGLMDCSQLTFVMTDGWPGHTWYTTSSERTWINAWLQAGEFAKAEESFAALTKYAMTKEFYVNERYADNDPAFTPWQPNGSGSGRMIDVMLNYFEHRETR